MMTRDEAERVRTGEILIYVAEDGVFEKGTVFSAVEFLNGGPLDPDDGLMLVAGREGEQLWVHHEGLAACGAFPDLTDVQAVDAWLRS